MAKKLLTYEEYLKWHEEQEELAKNKREPHRPKVELFVDKKDKGRIIRVLSEAIKVLYNPLSEKFRLGSVHFSKTRFWAFAYVALAENNLIIIDNNVNTYTKFLEAHFDSNLLVDRKHVSDLIHEITSEKEGNTSYINIKKMEDIENLGHITTTEKTKIRAFLVVRMVIHEVWEKTEK